MEVDTLRVQYALSFYNYFIDRLLVLHDTDPVEVLVTSEELYVWLAASGFASYFIDEQEVVLNYVPTRGTPAWSKFIDLFGKVRKALNLAAEHGAHGDPAYRVDFVRPGTYVARNLPSQALVTNALMTKSLLSLVKTKDKGRARQYEYLQDNFGKLPPALQGQVSSHDRMFKMISRRITADLNEYLTYVTEDYQAAQEVLKLPAPEEVGDE